MGLEGCSENKATRRKTWIGAGIYVLVCRNAADEGLPRAGWLCTGHGIHHRRYDDWVGVLAVEILMIIWDAGKGWMNDENVGFGFGFGYSHTRIFFPD